MFKQLCFRLLLLASAIASSLSAAAYSFESAGIYYNITGDNTVEVTYSDRNNNTYLWKFTAKSDTSVNNQINRQQRILSLLWLSSVNHLQRRNAADAW